MRTASKWIRIAIVVICGVLFLALCGMMLQILVGYARDKQVNDKVNQGFEALESIPRETESMDEETEGVSVVEGMSEEMREQYAYLLKLKEEYPDVVGYVSVPSVSIHYPVVQTTNNTYYLDHLITGEKGSSGTVFLDYRCDADANLAKNSVLYGHNMNNRTMFHNVELLFSREAFEAGAVEYITEEGIFIYKPLSVYRTTTEDTYDKYLFSDDEEYMMFCEEQAAKSRFATDDLEITPDSGVITFVTCTNSVTDKTERYIYQAVLERVYLPQG